MAKDNKKRLLFVDDDIHVHKMVDFYLDEDIISVDFAANGRVAVYQLSKNSYDLIISDLQMPEMDGLTLLDHIRQERIKTPVIIASSYGMDELTDKALQKGAIEVIQKPFTSEMLLSKIDIVLNTTR